MAVDMCELFMPCVFTNSTSSVPPTLKKLLTPMALAANMAKIVAPLNVEYEVWGEMAAHPEETWSGSCTVTRVQVELLTGL